MYLEVEKWDGENVRRLETMIVYREPDECTPGRHSRSRSRVVAAKSRRSARARPEDGRVGPSQSLRGAG